MTAATVQVMAPGFFPRPVQSRPALALVVIVHACCIFALAKLIDAHRIAPREPLIGELLETPKPKTEKPLPKKKLPEPKLEEPPPPPKEKPPEPKAEVPPPPELPKPDVLPKPLQVAAMTPPPVPVATTPPPAPQPGVQ